MLFGVCPFIFGCFQIVLTRSDDLFTVILQTLTAPNFKKLGSEQQQRIVSYAEENFMKIPTTSIKRKQRETILNEIQRICDWKAIAKATLPLSLVVKLMDAPNLTANIVCSSAPFSNDS